jgi:3-hydroxyacyl-CoA dehydrogenase/enoyl-CoA hydratase/3-hydroxybutyryl-CoA epimerase
MTSWRREHDVYELELDQAPANEIGLAMLEALEHFVAEVEGSSAKAVIVYSARPSGFSAGADLRALFAGMNGREPAQYLPELRSFVERIHAVANRFDALPQITFAALHGVCFGGGLELALLCDVLIADRTTRFAFPELRLGIIPGFGGIARLQREVPNAVVRDLLLTGRSINAKRAHELGLVSQLVAAQAALPAARAAARQAARFDSSVNARAKACAKPMMRAELAAELELFMQMVAEPRVQAALADFVARKDPLPYLPRTAAPGGTP